MKVRSKSTSLTDESRSAIGVICLLAWPVVLEQLFLTLVNYVDVAMVGAIGDGTQAGASIGVIAPFTWMINGLFSALGIGFSVYVGRAFGAGDYEHAKRIARQGLIAALCLGALATLLVQLTAPFLPSWMGADPALREHSARYFQILSAGYTVSAVNVMSASILRCAGDTKTPFICNVFMNIMNAALNFLFIFPIRDITLFGGSAWETTFTMWGANMGVAGAALASAISITTMGCVAASRLFLKKYPARLSLKSDWRFDKAIWAGALKLSLPVALERITQNLGQITMTALVTGLGTASLAAHNYAITAESITYMPAFGFAAAATTLVAQSLGAKKPQLAYKYGKLCIWMGAVFMTAMGVLLYLFSYDLVGVFSSDPQVIALGGRALRIEAFAQPFFAMQMVASGALRGGGDTRTPFFYSMIGMWGVRVATAVILIKVFKLGLMGAWIAMVANITVTGGLMLIRFLRKVWLKSEWADEAVGAKQERRSVV